MSSARSGPPKHQNKYAWIPHANVKKNETEVGGKLKPYSEITGVCLRCKGQIEWKRKYGKYKPLVEPAKCQKCTKRNVRQAYHNLCFGCAKEHNVCAKCRCKVARVSGKDLSEVEAEQKDLEEAIKNARERDRRTLIRAMNKGKSKGSKTQEEEEEEEEDEDEDEDEAEAEEELTAAAPVNEDGQLVGDDNNDEEDDGDDDEDDDGDNEKNTDKV